jgi:triosephosphate isomerase
MTSIAHPALWHHAGSMRPVIIAANWKMHTTPADAGDLAREIARRTREPGVVRVICAPFVCLAAVRDAVAGEDVAVGAQNVHHELVGAYTGEISAPMLEGLASWVIVGHSERRRDAGETDDLVNAKLGRVQEKRLHAILCVGEQLAEREDGRAEVVVRAQVEAALAGLEDAAMGPAGDAPASDGPAGDAPASDAPAGAVPWLTIAYEPVWAIGTGRAARGADAAAMAGVIRETLGRLGFAHRGETIPILYGGSVTSATIGEFLAEPSIDGALVGGASLKVDEMAGIVGRAGLTARARLEAGAARS